MDALNFSNAQRAQVLTAALEDCIQADQDYKSGLITDRIAVEMVIVRQSRRKS